MSEEIVFEPEDLTPFQRKICNRISEIAKNCAKEVYRDPDISDVLCVAVALTKICTLLETVSVDGEKLRGSDKVEIAIYIGREALVEHFCGRGDKDWHLELYDLSARRCVTLLIEFAKCTKVAKIVTAPMLSWCA